MIGYLNIGLRLPVGSLGVVQSELVVQLVHLLQQSSRVVQVELALLLSLLSRGSLPMRPFHHTVVVCFWNVRHAVSSLSGVEEACRRLVLGHLQGVLYLVVVLSANSHK